MIDRAAYALAALLLAAPALAETGKTPAQQQKIAVPVVSVTNAAPSEVIETVLVTGTLVPGEEILVGPEVEGFRIVELLVDEGDMVKKGQVLARLNRETLDAQIAQSDAQIGRADAAIAQAKSLIAQAEATVAQSEPALARAQTLAKTGVTADATVEQRTADHRTAVARLASARQGLTAAEAEKTALLAQRRELELRLSRTEVKSPADGIVSRRTARVGGVASMAIEAMFRIIRDGVVELEAETPDFRLVSVREGQQADIVLANGRRLDGKVRLVSTEVDRATRMGRVRVTAGRDRDLRIGAFARGEIVTDRRTALTVPSSAVLYDQNGAYAQVVKDGRIAVRRVAVGLVANGVAEVRSGLAQGDVVVARAGAFLHDGDAVESRAASQKAASKAETR